MTFEKIPISQFAQEEAKQEAKQGEVYFSRG